MEKEKLITLPLVDVPTDVNTIIREEQLRIELHEKEKLKKEYVVYRMLREWNKYGMGRPIELNLSGETLKAILKRQDK